MSSAPVSDRVGREAESGGAGALSQLGGQTRVAEHRHHVLSQPHHILRATDRATIFNRKKCGISVLTATRFVDVDNHAYCFRRCSSGMRDRTPQTRKSENDAPKL